jgi:hypothetical protein
MFKKILDFIFFSIVAVGFFLVAVAIVYQPALPNCTAGSVAVRSWQNDPVCVRAE